MRVTIDKDQTARRLVEFGIPVPEGRVVTDAATFDFASVRYPAIVKPNDEGSSVSLAKVFEETALRDVLAREFAVRRGMLVQEFVSGREFTCAVVDFGSGDEPLVPSEIVLTKGDLFDYDAKYLPGGCIETTPADVPPELSDRIRSLALSVHRACGCRDVSRTDMILDAS